MGRGRLRVIDDEYSSSDSESRYGDPIFVERRRDVFQRRASSRDARHNNGNPPVIVKNLVVPGQDGGRRHRGASVGGQAAPVVIQMPDMARSPSRSRHSRHSDSSSSRSHSRSRHSARRDRDRYYDEDKVRVLREIEDRERQDRARKEQIMRDIEDQRRRDDDRRAQIVREQEDKEREAKRKQEELAARLRAEDEQKKREAKDLEKRILHDAEMKRLEEQKEKEEFRKQVIREEEEKKLKEKEKKRKEDEEFEARLRLQAVKAGWSDDYVEDLLHAEENRHRSHSRGHSRGHSPHGSTQLRIDYERPTWIRIHRKHILPETLNAYRLSWEYDVADGEYIMIKEYVNHDFQKVLFDHTKQILRSRKLITPGYEKETITKTTLKPTDERVIKKKGDKLYVVRSKSSSSTNRRLSIF